MTLPLPDPEIPSGATLGKYEILRKIATGGMAEIYLARVRGLDGFEKLVVLKRILPNVAEDPAFVRMFLDEARLAATLQHPNIADVYDVGSENKTYFFTMEYVHGEDARTLRIQARRLGQQIPLGHALAIVHGTASALDYAHKKSGPEGPLGLVHRDVSTSNILVSFDGAVKLVDFGIARATTRQTKTRTGTLKGKIPYMSPEQCQNRKLDRRSDLFSLGVVLYELTTGRRPFRGESDFEILDQIINKGAEPPSRITEYPPELERIVLRLLARPVDERYQSGEELLQDLEQVMSDRHEWVSPLALGRYMRTMFADKVKAWEQAEGGGTSLGEYIAQTVTSESMREQRRTPPSAFSIVPVDSAANIVLPPAPKRRKAWIAIAAVAAIAIGATTFLLVRNSEDPATPRESVPSPTNASASPAPPPAMAAPAPAPTAPTAAAMPPPAPETSAKAGSAKPAAKERRPTSKSKPTDPKKPKPKTEESWDPNSMYLPH